MATKLNPNALQDKAIEEAKLSQEVQDKLNAGGGVEEAPIDGKPYVRQDAGWVGYDYPETEPVVREFTEAGTFKIQVPAGKHYCKAFIVNGGNGGSSGGGAGGYTKEILFNVKPLDDIEIVIGNGGAGSPAVTPGGLSKITYNSVIYAPLEQPAISGSTIRYVGIDGVLNPFNEEDTNLYGASGSGSNYQEGDVQYGNAVPAGKTGGGQAYMTTTPGTSGIFYGAGGGGRARNYTQPIAGNGYRGYVYLKFT